ncbi:hypothetical protein EDC01DRAFT_635284 [Geopyxis carbonaria]|nr:hypothetical protein EDC01DRAFT_635284 [Geopyxis carbonaria]
MKPQNDIIVDSEGSWHLGSPAIITEEYLEDVQRSHEEQHPKTTSAGSNMRNARAKGRLVPGPEVIIHYVICASCDCVNPGPGAVLLPVEFDPQKGVTVEERDKLIQGGGFVNANGSPLAYAISVEIDGAKKVMCSVCKKLYANGNICARHMNSHNKDAVRCPLCALKGENKPFKRSDKLQNHWVEQHNDEDRHLILPLLQSLYTGSGTVSKSTLQWVERKSYTRKKTDGRKRRRDMTQSEKLEDDHLNLDDTPATVADGRKRGRDMTQPEKLDDDHSNVDDSPATVPDRRKHGRDMMHSEKLEDHHSMINETPAKLPDVPAYNPFEGFYSSSDAEVDTPPKKKKKISPKVSSSKRSKRDTSQESESETRTPLKSVHGNK